MRPLSRATRARDDEAPLSFELNDTMRERLRTIGLPVGTAVAVLGLWEAGVKVFGVAPIILPSPSSIGVTIVRIFPILMTNAVQTAWEGVKRTVVS